MIIKMSKLTSNWCNLTSHHHWLTKRLLLFVKFNPLWSITFWVLLISHVFLYPKYFFFPLLNFCFWSLNSSLCLLHMDSKVSLVSSPDAWKIFYDRKEKGNLNSSDWLIELNVKYRLQFFFFTCLNTQMIHSMEISYLCYL